MNYIDILHAQLPIDEGLRKFPYMDTVGKITIGVGRNLSDVGLHDGEIALLLDNDLNAAESAAVELFPNFDQLSDARKAVVINMAFNLGKAGLAAFQNTIRNVVDGRWNDAATAMLQSKWAQQVGARAQRLATAMKEG